jgi:hypothetical protein
MMGGVHAILGAAVGSLSARRDVAFLAGVGTHVVGDVLPHKDYGGAVEVPLLAAVLWWVGARRGWASPAFWGALGGAAPDIENALERLGLRDGGQRVFPTHRSWHGAKRREVVSQGALGLLCWALLRRSVDRRRAGSLE